MPSLLFAGEAFESKHSSSAHGAFSSGRNQAMKIIEWKKKLLSSQNWIIDALCVDFDLFCILKINPKTRHRVRNLNKE